MALITCKNCKFKNRNPTSEHKKKYCPVCLHPYKSKTNLAHSWWLIRTILVLVLGATLFYITFNNSISSNNKNSRAEHFNSFIQNSNSIKYPSSEFESLDLEVCSTEPTIELYSRSDILSFFNDKNIQSTYLELEKPTVQSTLDLEKPRVEIIIISLSVFLVGLLLFKTQFGKKYRDLFLIYPSFLMLIIGTSWLTLSSLAVKANANSGIDFYTETLLPTKNLYSLFTPWIYKTAPLELINDNFIYLNIYNNLRDKNYSAAIKFTELTNKQHFEEITKLTYYLHFLTSYGSQDIEAAAFSIFQAYHTGDQDSHLSTAPWEFVDVAFGRTLYEYAIYLNKIGEFDKSINLLSKLNVEDTIDDYDDFAWLVAYQEELKSNFENNQLNFAATEKMRDIATKYRLFSERSSPFINNYFRCELSEIHLNLARWHLASKNADVAIAEINTAHSLVKPDENTNKLLSQSLNLRGIQEFENGSIDNSISSFTNALNSDKLNEELKCRLALAQMTKAKNLAYVGQFSDTYQLTDDALLNCPNDTLEEMKAEIIVFEAQWSLRRGKLGIARELLGLVKDSEHRELANRAKILLNDSDKAKSRYRKLIEASKWAGRIPRITGSICNIDPTTGKCDSIILYDGDRQIGEARLDFSYVEINDFDSTILLRDTLLDGRFDTYDYTDAKQTRRLHEKDGDYLLDREVVFDNRGNITKNEKYSGRIFMKFPSGAIRQGCDNFSSCDAYLIVSKNGQYLGSTRPAINTQFPVWNTGAALDFKKGDVVTVTMMDYDEKELINFFIDLSNTVIGTEIDREADDFIDYFQFTNSLPITGDVVGLEGIATLYVEVSPTTAPPGMYDWDNSDYSNLYKHYNTERFNKEILNNIVQGAHDTEKYHAFTSTAVAWVLPEITLMPYFGRGKFIQGLIASMIATEVIENELENRDDIKLKE